MTKPILFLLAAYYFVTGLLLIIAPKIFYETVPGVSLTGSYNSHFIKDVGFAFLVSALALGRGAFGGIREIAIFGSAWPLLHAGFHCYMWLTMGFPLTYVAAIDWGFVILPGLIAVAAATSVQEKTP